MTSSSSSYSAQVDMFLLVGDRKLSLGQLGPTHCILDYPAYSLPADAENVLIIDENETRRSGYLPEGISPSTQRVVYQPFAGQLAAG